MDLPVFSQLPVSMIAFLLLMGMALFGYFETLKASNTLTRNLRTNSVAGQKPMRPHSLPLYHGWFRLLCTLIPGFGVLVLGASIKPLLLERTALSNLPAEISSLPQDQLDLFLLDAQKIAFGGIPSSDTPQLHEIANIMASTSGMLNLVVAVLAIALAAVGFYWSKGKLSVDFRARNKVETAILVLMVAAAALAVLTTFGIVFSLVFETAKFFKVYSILDFLFGTLWSPQIAIRADQVGQTGSFGAVALFLGTFIIMLIAIVVAVPIGLGSAIYLSEYATDKVRTWVKPGLELLAGIPTVVYGFFALLTVAPMVRDIGEKLGLTTSSQSALAAGLVMGIMIIPFVSSLSDDVINAVPQTLRDGSYALGATKSETISRVILPAALPGIVGSILLAISRALGETMIVAMAAGQNANLSLNPLDMMTTVTVQIVTLLTGDQEYDSPKTHAAFALGFVLFTITLILNVIALRVVQKYREKYD